MLGSYVGPWRPDPLVKQEQYDDVTLPFMRALELLSTLQRAAFLLHDHESKLVRADLVNGLPGFVTLEADGELQTTALEVEDLKTAAI